jgi:hypothetical protein
MVKSFNENSEGNKVNITLRDDYIYLKDAFSLICGEDFANVQEELSLTEDEEAVYKKSILCNDKKEKDPLLYALLKENLLNNMEALTSAQSKITKQQETEHSCNDEIYEECVSKQIPTLLVTIEGEYIKVTENFYPQNFTNNIFSKDASSFVIVDENGSQNIKGHVAIKIDNLLKSKNSIMKMMVDDENDNNLGYKSLSELAKQDEMSRAIARVHRRYQEIKLHPGEVNDTTIWGIILHDKPPHGANGSKWGITALKLIKSGKYPAARNKGFPPIQAD